MIPDGFVPVRGKSFPACQSADFVRRSPKKTAVESIWFQTGFSEGGAKDGDLPGEPSEELARILVAFGIWLKEAREKAGMDQRALEAACGIRQGTISRIERGESPKAARDPEIIRRLASALQVSVETAMLAARLLPDAMDAEAAALAIEIAHLPAKERGAVAALVRALRAPGA